jgi:thiamine-phosphate pyrophosphorylase
MQIVVISPEAEDHREVRAIEGFLAAGLERYHVRKPTWTSAALESWLVRLPREWSARIVVHGHAPLATRLGFASHDRDEPGDPAVRGISRSCHSISSLLGHLPHYRALLFGPLFPSLTKPGYRPAGDFPWDGLKAALAGRSPGDARVLAVGGITPAGLARCRDLGFDGAALLGAVWNQADPVAAYAGVRDEAARLEAARHAA